MPGTLGGDHDDIKISARLDQAEMYVEAMRKGEGGPRLHIGVEILGIDRGLVLVGREDHDQVGPFRGLGIGQDLEAGIFRLPGGRRAQRYGSGESYCAGRAH